MENVYRKYIKKEYIKQIKKRSFKNKHLFLIEIGV